MSPSTRQDSAPDVLSTRTIDSDPTHGRGDQAEQTGPPLGHRSHTPGPAATAEATPTTAPDPAGATDATGDDAPPPTLADSAATARPDHPAARADTARADTARADTARADTAGGDTAAVRSPAVDGAVPAKPTASPTPTALTGSASATGATIPDSATSSPQGDGAASAGMRDATAQGTQPDAEWRQVLLDFVDHPRQAVEKADRLVDDAVRSLTERIDKERSNLRTAWHTEGEPSTEALRNALRGYRDFFDRILTSR